MESWVDRAIVSGVSESEIQQIKQEYIIDRIKESTRLFGNKPELFGSIITTAIAVLALLISKVLNKAMELSERFLNAKTVQPIAEPSGGETTANALLAEEPPKPEIPPKPVMSAEASAYPKLLKIYKELNRQNGIIFDAERERNTLELERDSLKGFAKLTKKGKLQSGIDRKNEEIDLLKVGLSGIAKRYEFHTVHDFYKAYASAKIAYADYRDKADKWEENYGENAQKQEKESAYKRLQNYQRENTDQQAGQISKSRDRGTR